MKKAISILILVVSVLILVFGILWEINDSGWEPKITIATGFAGFLATVYGFLYSPPAKSEEGDSKETTSITQHATGKNSKNISTGDIHIDNGDLKL